MITSRRSARAFSLIELVIVVVIIGIIGAIAIPRMSRGSAGAADNAVKGNLAVLRSAIELFSAEHEGVYPDVDTIAAQLTGKTDIAGAVGTTAGTHIYGPYMKTIPTLPVGAKKGQNGIDDADGAAIGWLYTEASGDIKANCADAEVDASGTKYNSY